MRSRSLCLALCAIALVACQAAHAGSVSFNDEVFDGGAGFGNVANLLGLQNTGAEWGHIATSWNGTTFNADTNDGDYKNGKTWSLAELSSDKGIELNASNFGVVFNINQTGANPTLTLHGFQVTLYLTDGSTINAAFDDAPLLLDVAGQGTGSAGYLFRVHLSAGEATSFFGDTRNRIGMGIDQDSAISQPITGSNDGIDNFYIASAPVVPLPGAAAMGAGLIGCAGFYGAVKKRLFAGTQV